MANAKQCDRCGEFYVDMPKSEIDFLTNEYVYVTPLSTIESISVFGTGYVERNVDLDLCQKCLDEFCEWMRPINERA
jgi:hypothetical protein